MIYKPFSTIKSEYPEFLKTTYHTSRKHYFIITNGYLESRFIVLHPLMKLLTSEDRVGTLSFYSCKAS